MPPRIINECIPSPEQLKAGLRAWAEANDVRPAHFGREMGYLDPSYGWGLLRGKTPVTMDCLGRFLVVYGAEGASDLLAKISEVSHA